MKKTILKIITAALAFVLTFSLFTGCNTESETANAQSSYVSLSINPLVELIVDENNTVTAVNCANEDAEILLSDVNLIGMTIEEASEMFLRLATEAGYIDVESQDNEITVTVVSEEADTETQIKDQLRTRLNNYFNNNGIFGKVSEETLETFGAEIDALDIPLGKKKMIMRALEEDSTLDINVLKDMPVNELVRLFKDKVSDGLDSGVRSQFKAQKDALREQYMTAAQQMFQQAKDALNAQYQNMFALGQDIEDLELQIEEFTGTDEDKDALIAQLAQKQAQHDVLKTEFDAAMEQAKEAFEQGKDEYKAKLEELEAEIEQAYEEHKQVREQLKEQQKEQKRQRLEQNSQIMEQHRQEFQSNSDQTQQAIESWRKGQGGN